MQFCNYAVLDAVAHAAAHAAVGDLATTSMAHLTGLAP